MSMASSSGGNSSGILTKPKQLSISGSEKDLQLLMDKKKRKRMESNRESARRSRMRKQKHLDDLTAQVERLTKENSQILRNINITTQQYLNTEAKNSVLRAQISELSQRLQSLNEILSYMNTNCAADHPLHLLQTNPESFLSNYPWNLMYPNPITASAGFQY